MLSVIEYLHDSENYLLIQKNKELNKSYEQIRAYKLKQRFSKENLKQELYEFCKSLEDEKQKCEYSHAYFLINIIERIKDEKTPNF